MTAGFGLTPLGVLIGNGNGTFAASVNIPNGSSPYNVVAGDWNGDGKVDLATTNGDKAEVSVLFGNGNGTFQAPSKYSVGAGPQQLVVQDFNGDGKLDYACASGSSSSVVVLIER